MTAFPILRCVNGPRHDRHVSVDDTWRLSASLPVLAPPVRRTTPKKESSSQRSSVRDPRKPAVARERRDGISAASNAEYPSGSLIQVCRAPECHPQARPPRCTGCGKRLVAILRYNVGLLSPVMRITSRIRKYAGFGRSRLSSMLSMRAEGVMNGYSRSKPDASRRHFAAPALILYVDQYFPATFASAGFASSSSW